MQDLRPRRATYADLEAVPGHLVAELIMGVLSVMPRPASRHALAASALGHVIGGPFGFLRRKFWGRTGEFT